MGAIDPRLRPFGPRGGGSPFGGTADHMVPLGAGGGDDDANLRAAHWTCNVRRRSLARLACPPGVPCGCRRCKPGQIRLALTG
jgi:hypothetical protein